MATPTMESVSTKLHPDEKRAFLETCESIGTSPGNALCMFVFAFNRRGGFPFDPSNPYGFNSETLAAMDDAAAGRASGPYDTVSDMITALDKD